MDADDRKLKWLADNYLPGAIREAVDPIEARLTKKIEVLFVHHLGDTTLPVRVTRLEGQQGRTILASVALFVTCLWFGRIMGWL